MGCGGRRGGLRGWNSRHWWTSVDTSAGRAHALGMRTRDAEMARLANLTVQVESQAKRFLTTAPREVDPENLAKANVVLEQALALLVAWELTGQ